MMHMAIPAIYAPAALPPQTHLMDVTENRARTMMFVVRVNGKKSAIVELDRARPGTPWRLAGPVPFSGTWSDLEEVLVPGDRAMIFASNRPSPGESTPIDGRYDGKRETAGGGRLWIVRRTASGWATPQLLPAATNAGDSTFSPAVAADGTLYFMRPSVPDGTFHLFVSQPPYRTVRLAPFASATAQEFDPTVTPDGNTVVFSSTRGLPAHTAHLFVSYRHGAQWTQPRDLGPTINFARGQVEPRLLPDGRLCYSAKRNLYCTPFSANETASKGAG